MRENLFNRTNIAFFYMLITLSASKTNIYKVSSNLEPFVALKFRSIDNRVGYEKPRAH